MGDDVLLTLPVGYEETANELFTIITISGGMKSMSHDTDVQGREFFRLKYPLTERPSILINGQEYEVAEISEKGARILLSGSFGIDEGKSFTGRILFHDDEIETIEAVAMRSENNELAANLTHGITMKRMIAEQIWLRKKFPDTRPASGSLGGRGTT